MPLIQQRCLPGEMLTKPFERQASQHQMHLNLYNNLRNYTYGMLCSEDSSEWVPRWFPDMFTACTNVLEQIAPLQSSHGVPLMIDCVIDGLVFRLHFPGPPRTDGRLIGRPRGGTGGPGRGRWWDPWQWRWWEDDLARQYVEM